MCRSVSMKKAFHGAPLMRIMAEISPFCMGPWCRSRKIMNHFFHNRIILAVKREETFHPFCEFYRTTRSVKNPFHDGFPPNLRPHWDTFDWVRGGVSKTYLIQIKSQIAQWSNYFHITMYYKPRTSWLCEKIPLFYSFHWWFSSKEEALKRVVRCLSLSDGKCS